MHKNSHLFFTRYVQSIASAMGELSVVQCRIKPAAAMAIFVFTCMNPIVIKAQEIINIYSGSIPGSIANNKTETKDGGLFRNVTNPTLEAYLPEKEIASGTAVIICPGGSYAVLVYDGEGVTMAKAFQQKGIAAFVLKYRLPDNALMQDKSVGPLQDAQQAIKLVRERAAEWGIDPGKIGIMGFSAGGHLASTVATHFDKPQIKDSKNTSVRPDFQILVYPVISMQDALTHPDSRKNLLGANSTNETRNLFSNELQVTKQSPPAYITHASDDKLVDVRNSIRYYEALQENGIPVEMHLYQKGGHGFIFRQKDWVDPLFLWLKNNNWIKPKPMSN